MTKRLGFLFFNFLGLQVTWAACAYGAIQSQPLIGVTVGCIYLFLHFLLSSSKRIDLMTMLSLSIIGILLDYTNMRLGIISFDNVSAQQFIPLWLVTLWCVFSLMIPHSLCWLREKPLLAFVLGGIGGSSSYWLGHKLGAITLSDPLTISVAIYFIQWAIYLPIAYIIYKGITRNTQHTKLHQT